jgi:hypothetical protein
MAENKKRPGTLSSPETPEQPSPELFKATLPAVRSVCELNSRATPMARAGYGIEEGCGYRAGRRVFVPYWLDATGNAADFDRFSGAGAITAVTVKRGLPLTPTGPAPYILHRGSYEGYP